MTDENVDGLRPSEPDPFAAPTSADPPGSPGSPRVYLPVPLQRRAVDVAPTRPRLVLPPAIRRAALAVRGASRNPAVLASVTALATLAAQAGLRALEAHQSPRPTPAQPGGNPLPRGMTYVRITEIRSVIVEVRDV